MTDDQIKATEPVTTPVPTPTPPAPPTVDVEAIQKEATKKATEQATQKANEIVAAKMKQMASALTGEQPLSANDAVLKDLLTQPAHTLAAIKEMAKKEIREENNAFNATRAMQREVAAPFIEEYPEITGEAKVALVDKFAEQFEEDGLAPKEALAKAFEETVKAFGLKKVSETQRNDIYSRVSIPGGGGVLPGANPSYDPAKSTMDFLTGMKEKTKAVRAKK